MSSSIEFANYPQFHEELLKEQEELFKDNDGNLLNKLAKMEKLDSFVKEALRVNTNLGRFYIFNSNSNSKLTNIYVIFFFLL